MSIHEVAGIREGDILAGKYRVDRLLGVGGMGAVVAAHHIQLDDRVAIKFLLPEVRENGEAVARFLREARAAVKIKSQHVARVSDVGTLDNGLPYMIMEYLDGSDLDRWLAEKGPLPVGQACELVLQACEAIAEAHALGIVHRDLKPANLFVIRRPDGVQSIKVLDFGISKVPQSTTRPGLTRTAMVMGSPLYMSPEQIESSRDVDQRTDIWALGVILYELTTGSVPFEGTMFAELAMRIITQPPVPLRDKCAHAPEGFERVILKCLDKDPARRFQSVADLAEALSEFAPPRAQRSVSVISGILKAVRPLPSSPAPAPAAEPTRPHVLGRSTIGGVPRTYAGRWWGALVLAALAALAWFGWRAQSDAGADVPSASKSVRPAAAAAGGGPLPAQAEAAQAPKPALGSGAVTAAPVAAGSNAGHSALAQPRPSRDTAPRPLPTQPVTPVTPRTPRTPLTIEKKAADRVLPAPAPVPNAVREPKAVPVKEKTNPWGGRL